MGLATSWIALPPPSWGEEAAVLYTGPMGEMFLSVAVISNPWLAPTLLAWPDIATHSGDPRNPIVSVSSAPVIGAETGGWLAPAEARVGPESRPSPDGRG